MTKSPPESRALAIVAAALPLCIAAPVFFDALCACILFSIAVLFCRVISWAGRLIWPRSWSWFVTAFALAVALKFVSLAEGACPNVFLEAPDFVIPAVLVGALVWTGFGSMRKSAIWERLETWAGVIVLVLTCGVFREYVAVPTMIFPGVFFIVALFISLYSILSFKGGAS